MEPCQKFSRHLRDQDGSQPPSLWPLSELRTSACVNRYEDYKLNREFETSDHIWHGNRIEIVAPEKRIMKSLFGRPIEESLEESFGGYGRKSRRRDSWHTSAPISSDISQVSSSSDTLSAFTPYKDQISRPYQRKNAMLKLIDDEVDNATVKCNNLAIVHDEGSPIEVDIIVQYPSPALERASDSCPTLSPAPERAMESDDDIRMTANILQELHHHQLVLQPPLFRTPSFDSNLQSPKILTAAHGLTRSPSSSVVPIHDDTTTKKPRILSHRKSAPSVLPTRELETEDPDATLVDGEPPTTSPSASTIVNFSKRAPKTKSKDVAGRIHACHACSTTFTRSFDLQRHTRQKHGQASDGETAVKTCTHCGVVLSRADAAIRHVKGIPDSCNYVRKKAGEPDLPLQSQSFYDGCKTQYTTLAEEYKKPKGRKKANAPIS